MAQFGLSAEDALSISKKYTEDTIIGEGAIKGNPGKDGADGKSAYQSWLDLGNTGTEQDFINSLNGADGQPGANGEKGDPGEKGDDGKSAYQYAQDGGYIGTETEFTTNIARSGVISKELEVERARIDNLTTLQDGSTTGDAELIDARIDKDGNTHVNVGEHIRTVSSQISNEIGEICNNNFDGYQFLKEKNRTDNQYYNNKFEIITIDEPYATYEPLELIAGTYYFHRISHYFSFVEYKNGTVIRLLDLSNAHSDNQVVKITFTENVTLYITVYNISFDNFPAITKGFMCADNVEGAFNIKGVNLTSMTRWRNGSYNYGNEWAVYDYFDNDYRYTTSNTFEFDYPVVIKNTDTSKYLYYIAYTETRATDYNNKSVIIPSNTRFRIGVKYKDDRLLTNEEQVYLRENVIIIQNMNYSYVNDVDEISEGENVIITVGENANYSTIQEALNVITDANENKRYTVLVKRGVYDISSANINHLPLMSYVHIKGESKFNTIIKFYSNEKNALKNVFENHATLFKSGLSEVSNFTIETDNIKGALHLDATSWNGTVYFHDVIINSISTEEVFDESADYYHYMRASKGVINLGIHLNQKVVIENVQTNGYIYTHSSLDSFTNMEHENAGTFEVRNCTCDWIGVYGNGEAVRKHCVFEGNKCHFIKIAFIDNHNLGFMCWDVTLKNNHTDFIACQYFEYADRSTIKRLTDNYYTTFPFADPNLHNVIHNTTGVDIMFGSKLKYTDYTRRYVTVVSDNDYDAIAVQTIKTDWYGVVQEGGNKEHYLEYLKTHELS